MSKAGTPGYIAPEVFESQPYTEKGDVFSLGVIFYSLVSGRSPFKGILFNYYAQVIIIKRSWKLIEVQKYPLISQCGQKYQRIVNP